MTIDDICNKNNYYKEVLESMIGEEIELLDDKYVLDTNDYLKAKKILISYIENNKSITLGEYKKLINSSRKNCLIILEHFDRKQITKRIEDRRVLY